MTLTFSAHGNFISVKLRVAIRITMPIKDFNIIGNGPDVLKQVVMVADDLDNGGDPYNCTGQHCIIKSDKNQEE